MAEVAHGAQHEFWRPPIPAAALDPANRSDAVETCHRCETEFIVGSRYCHSCGAVRPRLMKQTGAAAILPVTDLAGRLGLSVGSFIAFAVGILFVLFAAGIGIVYSARTVADWQAIQLWRIEWLLAAVAAFVAGCLLKRDL